MRGVDPCQVRTRVLVAALFFSDARYQFFFLSRFAPYLFFFFFQAEDGIRDLTVTGVQTCALPILPSHVAGRTRWPAILGVMPADRRALVAPPDPRNFSGIYDICMVCLGNICRSPMAEVIVKAELEAAGLADRVSVQSAGTGDWHLGEAMDRGARAELARRGFDGSAHRARQIGPDWLGRFDLLLAMDRSNLRGLERMAVGRPDLDGRIRLLRSFDPDAPDGAQVPDPYGGRADAFTEVFDQIAAAAKGLVGELAVLLGG